MRLTTRPASHGTRVRAYPPPAPAIRVLGPSCLDADRCSVATAQPPYHPQGCQHGERLDPDEAAGTRTGRHCRYAL